MGKYEDLSGKTFGRLQVIKRVEDHILPGGKRKTRYLCKCECGKEVNILRQDLISGKRKSCGHPIPAQPTPKGKEKCFYNDMGIICTGKKCSTCGWNPFNTDLREKRIADVLQKPKKQEDKSEPSPKHIRQHTVYCVELDKTFPSLKAAAKAAGVSYTCAMRVMKGVQESTLGYHFKERSG